MNIAGSKTSELCIPGMQPIVHEGKAQYILKNVENSCVHTVTEDVFIYISFIYLNHICRIGLIYRKCLF